MIYSFRMKKTRYQRLTDCEREEISRGLAVGETVSYIAKRLSRHSSTISREIARNSGISGYRAFSAGRKARAAASSRRDGMRRIMQEQRLRRYVISGLRKYIGHLARSSSTWKWRILQIHLCEYHMKPFINISMSYLEEVSKKSLSPACVKKGSIVARKVGEKVIRKKCEEK